jgi:uncharacterized OsmC-like protein
MAAEIAVSAVWRGGWATDVCARGHHVRVDEPVEAGGADSGHVRVDEPVEAGGADSGMMPTELLCASMASCFCLAVAFAGSKRGIEVPRLRVDVRADRAGDELRYARLVVETSADLDAATLARLVERARALCWVSNTLAAGPELEYVSTSVQTHFPR